MFRKKSQKAAEVAENIPALPGVTAPVEITQVAQDARRCTIIAQDTVFTGNTEIEGDIQVYGIMQGHINLKDGILYVMRDGFIDGEFTAPGIIINGRVKGTCISENIEIHEHGSMEGISRSNAFSIRPGGAFLGQAERRVAAEKKPEAERVIKIKKQLLEKPVEHATGIS
ncbi:bactofilin family protein [Cedecea colo]|nr:polymer-forming cytoskeletal protein [Cedecea colo]